MSYLFDMGALQDLLWQWAYTIINGAPPTVTSLQVVAAQDNTVYQAIMNGTTYAINSNTGSTTNSIVAAMVAAINATAPDVTAVQVDAQNFTVTANTGIVISQVLLSTDPMASPPLLVGTAGMPKDNVGFAFADDPKMAHDFVSLKIGGPQKVGGSDVVFAETDNNPNPDDQNLYLEGIREFPVEVKVLSNTLEAVDWAAALQASFENTQFQGIFEQAGRSSTPPYSVVTVQPGEVQDLTGPLETQYEHVMYFDFNLRVTFQTSMGGPAPPGPGFIDEIQISGQMGTVGVQIDVTNPDPEP